MYSIQIAKRRRHCDCGWDIPAGEACLVFGKKEERVCGRNLCFRCLQSFLGRITGHNSGDYPIEEGD